MLLCVAIRGVKIFVISLGLRITGQCHYAIPSALAVTEACCSNMPFNEGKYLFLRMQSTRISTC